MSNADIGFNRQKLINLFLKESQLTEINFDENFFFTDPQKVETSGVLKNTKLPVIAKIDSDFYGVRTLHYNRVHVSLLPVTEIQKEDETTLYSVLYKINQKYGLFLSENVVEDSDITAYPNGLFLPRLIFIETSLIFYSGPIIN